MALSGMPTDDPVITGRKAAKLLEAGANHVMVNVRESRDKCQTNKPGNAKPNGTMVPVEIPEKFWECVSTDLITALPPTTSGHDAIAVFVDKLSKMVHVEPCHTTINAEEFASLYLNRVIRYHGKIKIPKKLLSDRDARFTGHFGVALHRLMGLRQAFSKAFHPQTDGQTERMNRVIEDMIRHYVGPCIP